MRPWWLTLSSSNQKYTVSIIASLVGILPFYHPERPQKHTRLPPKWMHQSSISSMNLYLQEAPPSPSLNSLTGTFYSNFRRRIQIGLTSNGTKSPWETDTLHSMSFKGKKIMVKMRKDAPKPSISHLRPKTSWGPSSLKVPSEPRNGHKWDTGRIVYLDLFLYSIQKRCWLPDPLDFSRLALLGRSLPLPRFPSHSALHLAEMGTCRKLIRFSSFVKSSPFWVLYFISNFNVSCYPPFRN